MIKNASIDEIDEQVFVRLVLSGMYPLLKNDGTWMYFITGKGEYVGTCRNEKFEKYYPSPLNYLGEGLLTIAQLEQVRKLDYLLTDEYKLRFEKWKEKVLSKPIITNINKGICQGRIWEGDKKHFFVSWQENGKSHYRFFELVSSMYGFYNSLKNH